MKSEFDNYYQEYSKKVYLFLMSMCHDPDVAEELTQETFYQAIKSINKFRGECSVYTWLCRIAKNMWLRELERRKRHKDSEYFEDNQKYISEICEDDETPEEKLIAKEGKIDILKRLHSLPETEKEIILLRASGELSFREIGEIFDKTENWARVTYYRAKQKLKKL